MKRSWACVPLIAAIAVAASCAKDVHQYKITDKDKFIEEIKDMKGLSFDENRLLGAAVLRRSVVSIMGNQPDGLVGKTVGDLISEQRTFEADAKKREAEQAALAAKAKAEEDAKAAELRQALKLTVYKKGFRAADYQEYITIACAYENTSGKDIRAFTGTVHFTDLFDKPVYSSNITINDPIKAGATAKWDGEIRYNKFVEAQRNFAGAELKNLKVEWAPASVIYAGAVAEAPAQPVPPKRTADPKEAAHRALLARQKSLMVDAREGRDEERAALLLTAIRTFGGTCDDTESFKPSGQLSWNVACADGHHYLLMYSAEGELISHDAR